MYLIKVRGIVQGVGFRPFIYREAVKRDEKGWVKNSGNGVEILASSKDFVQVLNKAPPLAEIQSYKIEKVAKTEPPDFSIVKSCKSASEAFIPPDQWVCPDCLDELRNKKNRRFGYYFITCTNCGPRFSMISDFSKPYDRPQTSMKKFKLCKFCKEEYTNPTDRRYHAQTIACKSCGPKLKFFRKNKPLAEGNEAIAKACEKINSGEIVAIKGNGGFHLACLPEFVRKLRKLTGRKRKPYALMASDLQMIKRYCKVSKKEKEILLSKERPIVVLQKKDPSKLKEVSELDSLAIMLPYTALHKLLFDHINDLLIMTSANRPGIPISRSREEAKKLTRWQLAHERKIANRCDDSIVKLVDNKLLFLRRSRGWIPRSLELKGDGILALGAELDNVITVVSRNKAYQSQYIGDINNEQSLKQLKRVVNTFLELTSCKPKKILSDLHPDFYTSKLASELAERFDSKLNRIQHHLAHLASVAAEHNLEEWVGIACDGIGYGKDGKPWGGEVFLNRKRVGSLEEQPMIGGDSATRYPQKMLLGILAKFLDEEELIDCDLFEKSKAKVWLKQLNQNYKVWQTTSCGRILDSVAALLGLCSRRLYEGRPALLLESSARAKPYKCKPTIEEKERLILKTTPLVRFIYENRTRSKSRLAATAHQYLAEGLYQIAKQVRDLEPILFSGGVAYSSIITPWLCKNGVLINKQIPSGDGGISFGQAAFNSIFS